ncbi:FCD domain-containing protein [Arthrobacter sp. H5]|uniref:FadR/GntR family transcriptional regulator n=1 Tax=Arthrobacter sp. H5 TaxID=1267973 RepID=UPI0006870C2E|nr:FCD domain-containing protein [Arthrobacter sp. H5]
METPAPGPTDIVFSGLHASVVDQMGLAIGAGVWASGSIMRIEELEERYGVSRSVIREVLRVLASMGMVESRRRVGVQVLPATEWNLYDRQIIRWRLASPGRVVQLRSLTELRTAIEPQAARLAALRAPLADASELMGLAGKLWAAGQNGDTELFLKLDIQFHHLVLSSSGNEMFGKLNSLVAEVLTGRTHYGMMPEHPHEEALQLHVDVASAIQRGDPVDAHKAMLAIMERAIDEMATLWDQKAQKQESP